MRGFGSALSFLTVLGRASPPRPSALAWFPVVGFLLGGGLGLLWWSTAWIAPLAVAAAVVLLADLMLTGMLHFDGLADSADGLLPHLERSRRLEVMRTPETGAFGVTVVGAVLVARHAGLAAAVPAPLLLAGLWTASRGLIVWVVRRGHRARPEGLGEGFSGGRSPLPALAAFGAAAAAGWSAAGLTGALAVPAGLTAGALVLWLARRRVGGYTGDVVGAAVVLTETVGLLVASAGS